MGDFSHLVLQDKQILGPGADDTDHMVSDFFERAGNGMQHGDPCSATHTNDCADLFEMGRFAKGPMMS